MTKIKLFELNQQYFEALGFYASTPLQSNPKSRFTRQNLYYIFVEAGMLIPVLAFMTLKAQSVYEYGITFYTTITLLCITAYQAILMDEMDNIVTLIGKFEKFIEKRKL